MILLCSGGSCISDCDNHTVVTAEGSVGFLAMPLSLVEGFELVLRGMGSPKVPSWVLLDGMNVILRLRF